MIKLSIKGRFIKPTEEQAQLAINTILNIVIDFEFKEQENKVLTALNS